MDFVVAVVFLAVVVVVVVVVVLLGSDRVTLEGFGGKRVRSEANQGRPKSEPARAGFLCQICWEIARADFVACDLQAHSRIVVAVVDDNNRRSFSN